MNKKTVGIIVCSLIISFTLPYTVVADNTQEKSTFSMDNTITIDTPLPGNIYIMGAQFFWLPSNWTIIIGPITIRAAVTGLNGFVVDFYIDGELKTSDINPPFEYPWWGLSFGLHTIEVKLLQDSIVQDTDSIDVLKLF